MDRYTIGFWRKNEVQGISFDEIAQMAYDTICAFNDFPEEFRPNYQTARKKQDVVPFQWDYENFSNALKCNINREGKKTFEKLGYSIGFFSSLDDDKAVKYNLRVGGQEEYQINAFIIELPSYAAFGINTLLLEELFARTVMTFHPFWGGIINNAFPQKNSGFPKGKEHKLSGIHWINYWSSEMSALIDEERLININSCFPSARYSNGFLILQERPLEATNEKDQEYKKSIEHFLLDYIDN